MCEPVTLAITGASIAGSILKARAQSQAAEANAKILELNAGYADAAAADAVARGGIAEGKVRLAAGENRGQQIAARAASGVGLQGSPMDVLAASAGMSELDALTVRSNAAREAWGYRTKAEQFRYQASNERQAGKNAAIASILGGITGAARATQPMLHIDGQELPNWQANDMLGGAGYT